MKVFHSTRGEVVFLAKVYNGLSRDAIIFLNQHAKEELRGVQALPQSFSCSDVMEVSFHTTKSGRFELASLQDKNLSGFRYNEDVDPEYEPRKYYMTYTPVEIEL